MLTLCTALHRISDLHQKFAHISLLCRTTQKICLKLLCDASIFNAVRSVRETSFWHSSMSGTPGSGPRDACKKGLRVKQYRSTVTEKSSVSPRESTAWACFHCMQKPHLSIPHSHHHHQAKFPHTILPPHSPHTPEVSSMCRFKYADISGSPNLFLDLSFPCTYSCFHFSTINLSICLYFYQFVCMYLFTHGSIYINGSIQKDLCKTLSSTRLKAYKGFSTSEVRLLWTPTNLLN